MSARTAIATAAKSAPATVKATPAKPAAKTPVKATPVKATPVKATPVKAPATPVKAPATPVKAPAKSPVRTDVKPADVKPDPAATAAATAAKIADIRAEAMADMTASIDNVNEYGMKVAGKVLELFRLSAPKVAGVTVADYFAAMGIGEAEELYSLPACARNWLAGEVWGKSKSVPVADVQAMTGASRATIARYRRDNGLVNVNRDGGVATKEATKAAAAPAEVKVPGKVVQSLSGIVDSLDDPDMIVDLVMMLADKLAELDSDALVKLASDLATVAETIA